MEIRFYQKSHKNSIRLFLGIPSNIYIYIYTYTISCTLLPRTRTNYVHDIHQHTHLLLSTFSCVKHKTYITCREAYAARGVVMLSPKPKQIRTIPQTTTNQGSAQRLSAHSFPIKARRTHTVSSSSKQISRGAPTSERTEKTY